MKSIAQILQKFDPASDKYVSREFQSFGLHLAESLNDTKHKSLYIKLAKTTHRSILEKALSFVSDSTARNKGALFMWKLKQIKDESIINMKTARITIIGEVQGVGFRQFVFTQAKKRNLSGFVANLPDGKVQTVLTGSEKKILEVIKLCQKGTSLSVVSEVKVAWMEKPEKFNKFTIR